MLIRLNHQFTNKNLKINRNLHNYLFFFMQAYNLEPGHEYEFRVRAKNAAGFSKYSASSQPFKVRGKAGPPGPPRSPRVLRVGRNYVDLAWDAPASDGGM